MHDQARTISNGDVKIYLRSNWEFKGLTGFVHVSEKRDVLKRHSLAFLFVSFVMFLLLRLLILTWIS